MVHDVISRAIPEDIAVEDIVGIELSYTGGFFRNWDFDDGDIRRCVDLKEGRYVSRRRCSGNTTSKDLNADEVVAIRKIISDSRILDVERDDRLMLLDAGDHYITLLTGTDHYTIDRRCSVGPSFSYLWNGVMEIVALDDPPKGEPEWQGERRSCTCGNRTPTRTTRHTVQPPAY